MKDGKPLTSAQVKFLDGIVDFKALERQGARRILQSSCESPGECSGDGSVRSLEDGTRRMLDMQDRMRENLDRMKANLRQARVDGQVIHYTYSFSRDGFYQA